MVTTPPSQFSEAQYQVDSPDREIESIVQTPPAETEIDLEFLYTRDIEFRQETIYFIVVDRFYDGDSDNSEGPNPELYDPSGQDWGKYWGGDLQGVIDKLDYLKSLGVTAIWLTPLFEQVEDLFIENAAIHGYWTKDFKRINPRFIGEGEEPSLNKTQEAKNTTFDRLIAELHRRNMKLILDIVCNHTTPDTGGSKGELYDDGVKFDLDYRYNGATELIIFIDNHDMSRFQSLNPDPEMLRVAIALIMTSRGIPCIYYGTEQYLHDDTDGGNDPYNRPMMKNWDTDSEVYRYIRLLSGVRRLNPAVLMGSQWQKYITPDIYCYVRRYRDSLCFVALNRGEEVTIPEAETELPDGEHTCVLTRNKYEVKDGKIYDLHLERRGAIVFSHVGERIKGQTIVRAQLNGVQTLPGETVVVIGDCPELGNWDISKAYPLEYINSNTWFGEIPFNESAGKLVTYKYALWREGQSSLRENITPRRWVIANEGTVKWRDTWISERES